MGYFDSMDTVKFLVRVNGNVVIEKNGMFLYEVVDLNPNSSSYFSVYLHGLNSKIELKLDCVISEDRKNHNFSPD